MLTENDVVIIMCEWLQGNGYKIIAHKLDTSSGHDIEAQLNGRTIYVECKGGKSKRTGRSFSPDYQWRAAAGALFNQIRLREKKHKDEIGIALPDGERYPELMKDLEAFCKRTGIRVFWVSESREVKEWQCVQPTVQADGPASGGSAA